MKSFLQTPLTSGWLWEFSFVILGVYLFFHPVLAYPASLAVVLGGGLALLFFQSIPPETTRILGKPWILFLAYLLASSLWSVSPGVTLKSAGLAFLGTLLFSMAKANGRESQSRIEGIGLTLAFLASLMAVYQWAFGFEKLSPLLSQLQGGEEEILEAAIHNKRASGPFVTQGALAAFLILFIPLGFILMKTATGFKKKGLGFAVLVMVAGLLATQSVGAFLCLTLAVLAAVFGRSSKASAAWVLLAGILSVVLLISARGFQSWLLAALGTRLALWKAALFLFTAHPWLGTGLGTFDEVYQGAGLPLVTGARFPHNILLQILVETGLAGLSIFCFMIVDLARRFKIPSLWEGWGVMTGVLAFLWFSLLDLPFQMPEIIWFFAVVAARLELRQGEEFKLPRFSARWWEMGLLAVIGVSGFWPPFRAWNFALLACALWLLVGLFQQKFDKVPLWIFAGGLYLGVRAFVSPSAMGAVWFLELAGLLLAFYLLLPCFSNPQKFMYCFAGGGLVWALKIWWESFHYAGPGLDNWVHFQYSDVKDWIIFPNPKQVGLFLIPLVFILWKIPRSFTGLLGLAFALLTMVRLKAFGAFLGVGTGILAALKPRNRTWLGLAALALAGGLLYLRSLDPSATRWERLGIWNSAWLIWEQSPWVGIGPGGFAGYFHLHPFPRTTGVSRYLMDPQYAHNEYLELLTAFGLIGFCFVLLVFRLAWRQIQDSTNRSAVAGLGAASLVDFCLHTPLMALQATGLLTDGSRKNPVVSHVGGFLALGLGAGLFGPPIFSMVLKNQAESRLEQNQFNPEDLRKLETAERLNAWDARYSAAKAAYLEKLYVSTKDPVWAKKADAAFELVLGLEKGDGQWRLKNAERLSARFPMDSSLEAARKTDRAWDEARYLLPFNAFLNFENGLYELKRGRPEWAYREFIHARFSEPNFASAWFLEGKILEEKGEKAEAREAFQSALRVYDQWKGAGRIDPLEKRLVSLPPEAVEFLEKELALAK